MTATPEPGTTKADEQDANHSVVTISIPTHRRSCAVLGPEPQHDACWLDGVSVIRVRLPIVESLQAQLAAAQAERDEFRQMPRHSQRDEEAMSIIHRAAALLRSDVNLADENAQLRAQLEQQRAETQAARAAITKVRDWLNVWENDKWCRLLDDALARLSPPEST